MLDLDSGAQIQRSNGDMDFGGVPPKDFMFNTQMDSRSSGGHHSPSWQHGPVQGQMQALDTQHGRGHSVSHIDSFRGRPLSGSDRGQPLARVSAGARTDAWHFQQQHDGFLGNLFQQDTSDWLLAYNQFDAAATMTNGSPESQQCSCFHDPPRPDSEYAVSWESNFEQDTQHGNLVRRLNHVAQPAGSSYSYQYDPNASYRAFPNSLNINPPFFQPSFTDSRPHQNPHSNRTMRLATPIDAAPEQLPSCYVVRDVLGGASAPSTVTRPPKRNPLATKRNGGRRQGPLTEDARAHAASTRHDGSCWPCKIQRYKVSVSTLFQGWYMN